MLFLSRWPVLDELLGVEMEAAELFGEAIGTVTHFECVNKIYKQKKLQSVHVVDRDCK